MDEDRSR